MILRDTKVARVSKVGVFLCSVFLMTKEYAFWAFKKLLILVLPRMAI